MGPMKIKVLDENQFEARVFGGWVFLTLWPHALTEGVEVLKGDPFNFGFENYFVLGDDGKPVNDTAFFTEEDVAQSFMELIP